MGTLAIVVKTTTQPGKRDEVHRLYREMMAPRAEENEAQEVVVWCADGNDADSFFLFEMYRDMEAMRANAGAEWFGEYMSAVAPMLAGESEVLMGTPLWSTGL